jgi:FlaG/FlaF family flagellin (archaellin)
MRNSLRAFVIVLFLTALGATTASGQTFELFASESDLTPQGGSADAQCIVQDSNGALLFFNSEEGGIYIWDGTLGVHRSPGDLQNDVPPESNSFDRCDGVAIEGDIVYFLLRSSSTNDNFVYRTEVDDANSNSFVQFNGANAVAANAQTVYVGGVAALGAPDNGIYEVAADLSGSVSPVATNENVNPEAIDFASGSTLYGFSSSFGSGDFSGTVFSLDVSASSPSISLFTDPFGSNSPLTEESQFGGGIDDLRFVNFEGTDYLAVANGGGSDNGGPYEWGTIEINSQAVDLLFDQTDLETNLSVSGYSSRASQLTVNSAGEVFAASGGGPNYIVRVTEAPPLPVELTSFTVEADAQQAVLTWTTATETNNAGFEVQHQAPGAASWSQIGFEQGAGTTTEARSYRFTTDALQPGVHTFRLRQVDTDGTESLSDVRRVQIRAEEPVTFAGPNPVTAGDRARVTVQLDRAQDVTVSIYNVLGQQVDQLHRGTLQAGEVLETSVSTGNLPSGMYFLRVQGTSVNEVKKFTVVK